MHSNCAFLEADNHSARIWWLGQCDENMITIWWQYDMLEDDDYSVLAKVALAEVTIDCSAFNRISPGTVHHCTPLTCQSWSASSSLAQCLENLWMKMDGIGVRGCWGCLGVSGGVWEFSSLGGWVGSAVQDKVLKKIHFFGYLPLKKCTFDTADNLTLTKKQECQKDKYQNECLVWWWQSSFALLRWFTSSNTLPVSSGYTSLIWTFLENLNLKSQFWEKVWILAILLTVKINQEKDFIMERCQSEWKFNFEVFTPWLSY